MRHLTHAVTHAAAILAVAVVLAPPRAQALEGCDGPDPERRIASCSALIEAPDAAPAVRAEALFRRGLSYWQLSQPERALKDYDAAIRIAPRFAAALNNRADAYMRLGNPSQGVADIDQALEISPQNPIFNATRGQIGQALGDAMGAMRDHDAAMAFGGPLYVKLYQCGLKLARLYDGPLDGVLRAPLRAALRACVDKGARCDPLPESASTECREPVA